MTLTAREHVGVKIDTSNATVDDRLVVQLEDRKRFRLKRHQNQWHIDPWYTPAWLDEASVRAAEDCLRDFPGTPSRHVFTSDDFVSLLAAEGLAFCRVIMPTGATSPDIGDLLVLRFCFRQWLITEKAHEIISPVKAINVINIGAVAA